MLSQSHRLNKLTSGFTLIELILVIAIISIVSVMVVPKWHATSQGQEYETRRVLNDIRYVQAMSMLTGQHYRFVRTSATTYQLLNEAGSALLLPSGGTTITLSTGVSFGTFTNLPNSLVAFDSLGTPQTTSSVPGTALASAAVIPLVNGSTRNITISPQTGYGTIS
jgi:prepilin-type N-terminal cleavage/methylation domain-containing protein